MLCLSVRQPWAWAIIHGGKDVENRDWPTKVRGRVLIHAGKGIGLDEYSLAAAVVAGRTGVTVPPRAELTLGAILGSVEIVDCVESSDSPWFFGDYGFVLRDPRPLATPLPWRGSLGFFNVDLPKGVAL